MKVEQLYLKTIIPLLKDFKFCNIYNYQLKKFVQELAESLNQKNIYTALDIPDFKFVKETKLEAKIIKLVCEKMKIGNVVEFYRSKRTKILEIDKKKFQLIFFPSGTIPEIEIDLENLIFFMYNENFEKIYFCGTFFLQNICPESINQFYNNHCLANSKKFIDFKNLIK